MGTIKKVQRKGGKKDTVMGKHIFLSYTFHDVSSAEN